MPTYERRQVNTLLCRLAEPPTRLIVVSGPRQTGKTTLVRQALNRARSPELISRSTPRTPQNPLSDTVRQSKLSGRLTCGTAHGWSANGSGPATRPETSAAAACWRWMRSKKFPSGQRRSKTVKGLWDTDRAAGCPLHVVASQFGPAVDTARLDREPGRAL